MNKIKIPIVDRLKCDGKKNIAASVNIYNEKECLPILLESLKDFPVVFVKDGKWARFNDPKANPQGLSYDGSREIAKSFPNVVLIDCGNSSEEAQDNAAFKACALYGYDFLFHFGADEYVKGDYEEFQRNCYEAKDMNPDYNVFTIKAIIIHITPDTQAYNNKVPRLFTNTMFVRSRSVHWIFYSYDDRAESCSIIPGMTIYHDDRPRNQLREEQMADYQKINVEREKKVIGTIPPEEARKINKRLEKMWKEDMDFPPTISRNGNKYWTCGCIQINNRMTNRCNRHNTKDPPYAKNMFYRCGCIIKPDKTFGQRCSEHALLPPDALLGETYD